MRQATWFNLLICSMFFMITSCANRVESEESSISQEEIVALEKEVIGIHDEVMPRLTEISSLMNTLEAEAKNEALDAIQQEQIQVGIKLLKEGDSLMWAWMHAYSKPENVSLDSIHAYLQEEKVRISHVRGAMLESIRNANTLLQILGHGDPH